MSKKRKRVLDLWGTTLVKLIEVQIYIDPKLPYWAITQAIPLYPKTRRKEQRAVVLLHPDALLHPEILDELLVHEFIHVIEYMCADELRGADPPGCTRAATVFGEHLPKMFKYLKRVSSTKVRAKQ